MAKPIVTNSTQSPVEATKGKEVTMFFKIKPNAVNDFTVTFTLGSNSCFFLEAGQRSNRITRTKNNSGARNHKSYGFTITINSSVNGTIITEIIAVATNSTNEISDDCIRALNLN